MQQSLKDIFRSALFMSFLMLTIVGGVPAVSAPGQSGLVPAGKMERPAEEMLASEGISARECEVVYHRTSDGGYHDGYLYRVEDKKNSPEEKTMYASVEEDEDDMGELYYALYTCSGTAVSAGDYI